MTLSPNRPVTISTLFRRTAPWAVLAVGLLLAGPAGATPEPGRDLIQTSVETAAPTAKAKKKSRPRYRKLQALLRRFAEEARQKEEGILLPLATGGETALRPTRGRLARLGQAETMIPARTLRPTGVRAKDAPPGTRGRRQARAVTAPLPAAPAGAVQAPAPLPGETSGPTDAAPELAPPVLPRRLPRVVPASHQLPAEQLPLRSPSWAAPGSRRGPIALGSLRRVARIAAAVELDADPLFGQ